MYFKIENKIIKKIILTLLIIECVFLFLCLPISRKLIISFTENFIVHRSLNFEHWMSLLLHNFLLYALYTLFIIVIIFFYKQIKNILNFLLIDSYLKFFFICIIITFIISNVFIIINNNFIGYSNAWEYSDLLGAIEGYAKSNLFNTNYPPLAVCFYKFLYLFFPNDKDNYQYILNYILFFYLLGNILIYYITFNKFFENDKNKVLFSICLFFTGPFLFAFQRLNITLMAFSFLLIYLLYYSSENKLIKELSLVSLAIAANLKLFPAIFGIILIKNKKWKDAIRTFLYGICLFIMPLIISLILQSNSTTLNNSIKSIVSSSQNFVSSDWIYKSGISIKAFTYRFFDRINIKISYDSFIMNISLIISFLLTILCYFITNRKSIEFLLIGFLCVLIPTSSFWYSLIYLTPGLIVYLCENKNHSIMNCIISFLLILVFVYCYGYFINLYPHQFSWHILILWLALCVETIVSFIRRVKNANTTSCSVN